MRLAQPSAVLLEGKHLPDSTGRRDGLAAVTEPARASQGLAAAATDAVNHCRLLVQAGHRGQVAQREHAGDHIPELETTQQL